MKGLFRTILSLLLLFTVQVQSIHRRERVERDALKNLTKTPIRIQQVGSGIYVNAAYKAVVDARRQNIIPPTQLVELAATQTGSVQAFDNGPDLLYLAPVYVGGQKFMLDIDTGSADFWVFSKAVPKRLQKGHNIYQNTGTPYDPPETWNITYVDGTGAAGIAMQDIAVIGGATATQCIQAATSVAASQATQPADGVVGLAFDVLNTAKPYKCYTFMHDIGYSLPLPLFTVTLRRKKAGTFDFGFIDSSVYTGSIGYTPVDSSGGFWGITVGAYAVGDGPKQAINIFAIADTGSSFLYLPYALCRAYYSQVPGAVYNRTMRKFVFPCKSKLPNFALFLSGHKATVPGSYLRVGTFDGTNCVGGMQEFSTNGNPQSVLGDSFLKSQFVVFDYQGPQLGFAQQKGLPAS